MVGARLGIGAGEGLFGLFSHSALDGFIELFFEARRIHQHHIAVIEKRLGFAPGAGNAGRVVNDRELLARDAIKKR